MVLKQIPSSAKYLSSKQIYPQNPPEEIVRILEKKKKDSKSLDKTEISTLIDYLQNDFLKNYSMLIDEMERITLIFHSRNRKNIIH